MPEEKPELPTPYRYFVSYAHAFGFGCISISRSQPVRDMKHIKSMCDLIAKEGVRDPAILSFQLFADN